MDRLAGGGGGLMVEIDMQRKTQRAWGGVGRQRQRETDRETEAMTDIQTDRGSERQRQTDRESV